MITESIGTCPLFKGIERGELKALLQCLGVKQSIYHKDEFIFREAEPAVYVGIVLSGGTNVIQEDFWGNRTILTHVEPGGLFGEAFSCAGTKHLPVSVIAAEKSEIMLIDYRKISSVCTAACDFHSRMIANMMGILANKNILLTRKMEHISKRTTRDKLLSFLSAQAIQAGNNEATIPFNRQELADFLCVERSALSRELSGMKRDGLLDYDKNRFVLKNIHER